MAKYFLTLILATLVLFLHLLGMEYSLYFYYWWYDVLLHFLGGMTIASFLFIFIKNWMHIIIGMLIIAAGWEVFEYVYNIAILPGQDYVLDTAKDFVMDTLGALLIIILYKKWRI